MPYLIFKDTKFIGYSNNRKAVKSLISNRGNVFNIHKVEEININDIKNIHEYQLNWYPEYNMAIFNYEIVEALKIAVHRTEKLQSVYEDMKKLSRFIKYSKNEEKIITQFCSFIKRLIEDIIGGGESCVTPDDYFDIGGIVNEIIDTKH